VNPRRGHAQPDQPLSFTDFYRRTYSEVLHFVWQYAAPGIDAEEVVAEAFARACARWPELDYPRPWVYRVVINLAHDARKQCQRTSSSADPCPDDREVQGWTSAARLPGAEWGAQLSAIEESLRRLPHKQRVAVLLHYQGWTLNEIAATLGCQAGTVRCHLHFGRHKLRKMLAEQQPARQPAANGGLEGRTA
jgi:RNA polymerase sigma-70 factor (ECF subfamily)